MLSLYIIIVSTLFSRDHNHPVKDPCSPPFNLSRSAAGHHRVGLLMAPNTKQQTMMLRLYVSIALYATLMRVFRWVVTRWVP